MSRYTQEREGRVLDAVFGLALTLSVVLVTVGIHYEGLRLCSRMVRRIPPRRRYGVAVAMLGALIAHIVEILVFAVATGGMVRLGIGALEPAEYGFLDLMYVSTVNYTSLGIGDIVPLGQMRMLASLEALTGLVMIAWTASFSFRLMEHFWRDD